MTHFTFALYLAFTFSIFSVYLWRIVWSSPVSVQFFLARGQKNVSWLYVWVAKNSVLLYDRIYFKRGYIDILCVSRIAVKENVE